MKLGELKSQIRSQKGNPTVQVVLSGHTAQVTVQKTSIMATLDEMFGKARNAETGLYLREDGQIVPENGVAPAVVTSNVEVDTVDELDDLNEPSPAAEVIDDLDDL